MRHSHIILVVGVHEEGSQGSEVAQEAAPVPPSLSV